MWKSKDVLISVRVLLQVSRGGMAEDDSRAGGRGGSTQVSGCDLCLAYGDWVSHDSHMTCWSMTHLHHIFPYEAG